MSYDGDLNIPKHYLVSPPLINLTSGEYLAHSGVRTFACSETQKFGHVTYFWNGNRSGYFDETLESYVEIPSDICEFNEKPDMKAREIAAAAVEALPSFDMVRINIANGDMVGHTGDLKASIQAMETVDESLGKMLAEVDRLGGRYIVTADHGNADEMAQRDKQGNVIRNDSGETQSLTSHTLAKVPFCIGGTGLPAEVTVRQDVEEPGLANITASFIELLGFEAPKEYEESLLKIATK